MNLQESDWVLLAHIVRPQGRRGEVLCDLHTDFPQLFSERRQLFLIHEGTGKSQECTLEDFWLPTGRSAGRVVLKFQGTDSITAAEALAGLDVVLPASERAPLEEESFYVSDLQGCTVVNLAGGDGPDEIGIVHDVHFATDSTGKRLEHAVPILVVLKPNGDEVLIPLAKEFLEAPDVKSRRLVMRLPAGLVEANG